MSTTENGTVKWFNTEKGYGFITPETTDDSTKDVFVHSSDVDFNTTTSLQEGDKVSYEMGDGKKGPAAKNVTKLQYAYTEAENLDNADKLELDYPRSGQCRKFICGACLLFYLQNWYKNYVIQNLVILFLIT